MNRLLDRVRSAQTALARVTLTPLLVRAGIPVTFLTAFVLAYPVEVVAARVFGVLAVVAFVPALAPRRGWPTLAALLAVAGWLLSTIGYDQPVVLWQLLGLAGSLYLAHSLCALAAALPLDAVVDPEAVAWWALRALGVVLASAVLSVLLLLGLAGARGGSYLFAVVGGLATAVGAATLLVWLARRR